MSELESIRSTSGEPKAEAYGWYVVVLLMLVYASSFVDRTVIALLVKPIRADLVISDTQMSLLSGFAFALLYTILGIPIGRLADRRSRRLIISAGAATWSVMTAACGLSQNFAQLFLARLGVGIGEASLTPAAYSLISDYFPRRLLARALGLYNVGISLGSGLALLFGGLVIGIVTRAPPLKLPIFGLFKAWQTTFLIVALPGTALAALMWTVHEPRRHGLALIGDKIGQPTFSEVVGYLWRRREVYAPLYIGYSLFALVNFGFSAWIPTFFIRCHHWTAAETGERYGLAVLVFGTLGSLLGGLLADRLLHSGLRHAYVRIALLCGIGLLPCSIFASLMPTGGESLALFAVWLFLNGAWYSVCGGSIQLIAPNQLRGQATALMFLFSSMIGFGVGPTAIAVITDFAFGRDDALRDSLSIVGAAAIPFALIAFRAVEGRFAAEIELTKSVTK